jgi:predicted lipoprotein with Yx(FWY)xxD motif
MRYAVLGFGVLAAGLCGQAFAGNEHVPVATPAGITLQSVKLGAASVEAGGLGARQAQRNVYADPKGMTLYTYEKDTAGKSTCVAECATAWPAVIAPAGAKTFGPWTIVARDDGKQQWAFNGKPLYTYAKDAKIGDGTGNGLDSGSWQLAAYAPAEGVKMPHGVAVNELLNAGGEVFISEMTGTPLYTFDDDPVNGKPVCGGETCSAQWRPFIAAQLAKPVGDFTVAHRDDGFYQWAYKGKPLYTFDGDVVAGDAKGDNAAGKWHVASLLRQFMPAGVTVYHNRYGGDHLATADGMTLYERTRVIGVVTGHNLRTGMRGNPAVGRILGTMTCDAACTQTWKPLAAPADAQPSGYWEVATREDGSKQWSYRGYPVYTFSGDTKPGDMNGNDSYEIMGPNDPFKVADVGMKTAGAMVWHAIQP